MSNPVAFIFYSALALSTLPCPAYARFGQENAVQGIIGNLGGGQAAALAGSSIGTLLAGSNACDKLTLADQVATLDSASAIDAAKRLVQAERNFNPFAVDRPSICDDLNLPATQALRGILPLIDPAVPGADAVNAASAESLNNPSDQQGSQADLLREVGFDVFTPQGGAGGNLAAPEEPAKEEPANANVEPVGPNDFGSCANPAIDFGLGFDGRSENSFQPADKSKFTHGSALNIGVITDFICNRLKDSCKASQEAISACATAEVATQGKTGQAAADAFNTALGVGNGNSGSVTPAQPIQVDTASTLSSEPATGTATRILEFGSCTDPTIAFGLGFDGRQENSFKPNSNEFNHGSALNIGVIASFICGQLRGQCKAAGDAIAACAAAQSAASSATGQAAADLFNESLGFSSGTASRIRVRRALSGRSFWA